MEPMADFCATKAKPQNMVHSNSNKAAIGRDIFLVLELVGSLSAQRARCDTSPGWGRLGGGVESHNVPAAHQTLPLKLLIQSLEETLDFRLARVVHEAQAQHALLGIDTQRLHQPPGVKIPTRRHDP